MRKKCYKKSRIICFIWIAITIILLSFIWIADSQENTLLQEVISDLMPWYFITLFITCGVIAHISKIERKQKKKTKDQ